MLHVVSLPILVLTTTSSTQEVTRVSVGGNGAQGNGPSVGASLSADARFVTFESRADNWVPGDVNDQYDVFVRDGVTGTTTLLSRDAQGRPSAFGGDGAVISSDGRFVAFASWGDDIVLNDVNGWCDVFLWDRQTDRIECTSLDPSHSSADGNSRNASVSADGRFVAFDSRATHMVLAADVNATQEDVFVRDRSVGTTELVSVSSQGAQGNARSRFASLSADGRFVAFESVAGNLVGNDTNGTSDVFVHDRTLHTTIRVSVSGTGVQGDLPSVKPSISGDGRWVAFESSATTLDASDTNGTWDIYVHDLLANTTTRASVDSLGAQGVGHSFLPRMSFDGRQVVFESEARLDVLDTDDDVDVYVRDLQSGLTRRVSVTNLGQPIGGVSWSPAISADGSTVAFTTVRPGLVSADTNGVEDVFVGAISTAWTSVCVGDGGGSACPCGNESVPIERAGCAHSLGTGGRLSGIGTASVAADTLVLLGAGLPNGPALYFQGTGVLAQGSGATFGDGLRCATGVVVRLGVHASASGTSSHPSVGAPSISMVGGCTSGSTFVYQVWYRDSATYCTSATFNFTNGLSLAWSP